MEPKARLERQHKRRRQILGATLRLLRRHGTGISTAQIAAEANCSKETLYNWFDDRDGIFRALVEEQGAAMEVALQRSFEGVEAVGFRDKLIGYSIIMLDIMTGDALVTVNRVAMAQVCQENSALGNAVLDGWQKQVASPFFSLFETGTAEGSLTIRDNVEAFEVLMGLLVGDRQRRLLLGAAARPDPKTMQDLAEQAVDRWLVLFQG